MSGPALPTNWDGAAIVPTINTIPNVHGLNLLPKHMRYSALTLWLRYINRDPRVGAMLFGLLFGGMLLTPAVLMLSFQMPFLLDGTKVQGRVVGNHLGWLPNARMPLAVVSLFAHGGGGRRPRHIIRYEYTDAAGIQHLGEGQASFEQWSNAKPGSGIPVRYLQSDPQRSQLASELWDLWPALPFGLLGLEIMSGSLWHGNRGIRWANKQVRLVRWGQPICGRIIRADVEHRGKRGREVVCVLEYECITTQPVTGKLEVGGKPRPNWQLGGDILILFDPFDPTDHAPDIFDARLWDREQLIGRGVG